MVNQRGREANSLSLAIAKRELFSALALPQPPCLVM
jgi:hypothetical protein